MQEVMAVVLAGGRGSRLTPLTRDRAKPAVPFGGSYRIIAFALSNCLNSGLRKLIVLTQYKSLSLARHIDDGWRHFFRAQLGEFIDVLPPQQRIDEHWYQGTADAVYQNIYAIEKESPEHILILAGDHIYKMNYRAMFEFHQARNADLTVAALPVDLQTARQFGVIQVDQHHQITGFQEKPEHPIPIPGDDQTCLASMGIYLFKSNFLFEQLLIDANLTDSAHDFGRNIIPRIIDDCRVFAYPFQDENRKQQSYWRDVGTIDAYYSANMDLINVDPLLNLYDQAWPISTKFLTSPPPKFVFSDEESKRMGVAVDSIVCQGTIVSGGRIARCVIGPHSRINSYAQVSDSILFDHVNVGRGARIRRAIIDKNVNIPANTEIGFDRKADEKRGFTITENGVVVVGKSHVFQNRLPMRRPSWLRPPASQRLSTRNDDE